MYALTYYYAIVHNHLTILLVQLNRDKVLLEADESGNSDDGGEDEVFPLRHTLSDGSSDTTEDEVLTPDELTSLVGDNRKKAAKAAAKSKKVPSPPPSEKYSDGDEEEEEEGWGSKKSAYYSTNAPELDSEDEETQQLYLEESIRLQVKSRSRLKDGDFGLDDYPLLEKAWTVESV
jgi:U3 small nucleolar RNA-associated protein 3